MKSRKPANMKNISIVLASALTLGISNANARTSLSDLQAQIDDLQANQCTLYYELGVSPLPSYCPPPDKVVFVTNGTYTGSLGGGGFSGADSICQSEADASTIISGQYKAWISDGNSDPNTRFSKTDANYVTATGQLVATSWMDLTDGNLIRPINENQHGIVLAPSSVWTNTNIDGTALSSASSSSNCFNWTSTTTGGIVGQSGSQTSSWTYGGQVGCASSFRLYCVQQ